MEEQSSEKLSSRREVLRKVGKTAAVAIPTIMTFKVNDLHAIASEPGTAFNNKTHR